MIKKILLGLVAAIAVFCIYIALKPGDFFITRSSQPMAAPPEAPFALVNDFQQWPKWSPWEKLDPNIKKSFKGPASGVGAVYEWSGNSEVGKGSATITESKPNESIKMRLDFIEPMPGVSYAEFLFKPAADNKTVVTWNMSGTSGFVAKAFCTVMFMDMDKVCGDQFEKGLADMKTAVEEQPKQQ